MTATLTDARPNPGAMFFLFVIAAIAFLTVVDLFASQAILPSLAERYRVTPAAMGVAANAAALGMAGGSLFSALFGARIDRRYGVAAALLLLCVPTVLLAFAPSLTVFALLRVAQGLLMATAFSLTLAFLGEQCSMRAAGGAFAAYVTGNVAANLLGRLLAASLVEHAGLEANFLVFAALNAAGGILALVAIRASGARMTVEASPVAALGRVMREPGLRAAFGVGFLILFAFIGVFTYVNFVLIAAPFDVSRMSLGLVYFVFAPSIVTTPLAGRFAARYSPRIALIVGLGTAIAALPLLLAPSLGLVLAGMTLFAVGAFFAQAAATAFVSGTAGADKGAASALYLASYFSGGLAGAATIGPLFESFGWSAAVAGVACALGLAMFIVARLPAARPQNDAAHRAHTKKAFQPEAQMRDPSAATQRNLT